MKGCFQTHQIPPGTGMSPSALGDGDQAGFGVALRAAVSNTGQGAGEQWLSHPRGHHCIAGLWHEEKSSFLSLPCLVITSASGSCSTNPAGTFPARTAEGLGALLLLSPVPWSTLGWREGGRQQLLELLPSHYAACSHCPYQGLQVLQLVPQLEELRRRQQDGVQGVDHGRGKLEVLLPKQYVCHGVEDVFCIQKQTKLPTYHRGEKPGEKDG